MDDSSVTVIALPTFTRNIRAFIKKYRNILSDIQPIIVQNKPIKYLRKAKPTRENVSSKTWSKYQAALVGKMDEEYNNLAKFIVDKF